MLYFRLAVESKVSILEKSIMAAVYYPLSIFISALLINDFVYYGFNYNDLLRSSKAFKFYFLFVQVYALLEYITELSFLFAGSKFKASVYFFYAY